jgi:hypothetical protein
MIVNDAELQTTLERIAYFHSQLLQFPQVETNPENYRHSASGFLAELERMQVEVRDYLKTCPSELETTR